MLGLHKEIQNNVRASLRSQEIRWLSAVGFVPAPRRTGSVTRARTYLKVIGAVRLQEVRLWQPDTTCKRQASCRAVRLDRVARDDCHLGPIVSAIRTPRSRREAGWPTLVSAPV